MHSNFESHTILSSCLNNSYVSPAEATRMWAFAVSMLKRYMERLSLRFLTGRDMLPDSNFSLRQ